MPASRFNKVDHEILPVIEDGEELFTVEEVFPDAHPGKVLHGFRVMEGMTQAELANRLGITQHRISEMETGKRSISIEMAKRISSQFDVSYKAFI